MDFDQLDSETTPNFKQIQQDFSQHIRTTEAKKSLDNIEDRRLNIYRELFFNNIESFIAGAFPVFKELFNDSDWQSIIRDFFVKHECASPYFLEISEEFLSYLETTSLPMLPAFSYQLAHWEWMELHADVFDSSQAPSELSADSNLENLVLTIAQAAWHVAYEYPVHKISSENSNPDKQATFLAVYRNAELEVGFIEINPLSYLLFDALKNNQTQATGELLEGLASQQSMDISSVVNGGKQILTQWIELGFIREVS